MSTKHELLIEVYTDPMCPWCWIGHARLEETLNSQEFEEKVGGKMKPVVKLRPYILDTRLPGTDFDPPEDKYDSPTSTPYQARQPPTKREYYSKKFTNLDAFDAKIGKAAQEAHLDGFEWLNEGKVGATWLAHRLLWYALQKDEEQQSSQAQTNGTAKHTPGLQENLAARFYLAFHKENKDLSSIDTLSQFSTEVGAFQDASKARQWLESDEGDYEVGHAVDMGLRNGVKSVPFLIIQDGSDHTSEVVNHSDLMRMFTIQADALP